jgi:hypothetical protein
MMPDVEWAKLNPSCSRILDRAEKSHKYKKPRTNSLVLLCDGRERSGQRSCRTSAAVLRDPYPPSVVQIPRQGGQHAAAT